jgi:hypothetical protein
MFEPTGRSVLAAGGVSTGKHPKLRLTGTWDEADPITEYVIV